MSVKRYEWVACDVHSCHCDVVESAEGDMVDYEDYAALEQKLAESQREFRAADATIENLQMQLEKLAAENVGLKRFPDHIVSFIGKLGSSEIGSETKEKIEAAAKKIKTPSTEAVLAEVRASGIDAWIESRGDKWNGTTKDAERFAALLRKGVQP